MFSSDYPKYYYYYIHIENINSKEKKLNHDFLNVLTAKKKNMVFLIYYFSMTFDLFLISRIRKSKIKQIRKTAVLTLPCSAFPQPDRSSQERTADNVTFKVGKLQGID